MSLRPAIWPLGSNGGARRANEFEQPQKPELRLLEGGASPRLERLAPRQRLIALVSVIGLVLFMVVTAHVKLSQQQFALEATRDKIETEQDQYSKLRLQVAQLESPTRIKAEAAGRLGMVRPAKVTPLAPAAADMPTAPVTPLRAQSELGNDLDQWSKIKPQLSPANK